MTLAVDRRRVLDYRVAAQGLHRDTAGTRDLAVLDLGVQDTNVGSARLALAARLPGPPVDPDPGLTLLWSVRGAPHLHRTADLAALAESLWPLSDTDAFARLAAERAPFKDAGVGGLEAFTTASQALRSVVAEPMTKGQASAAVTERLPDVYAHWCRPCNATHVYGGLFQQVGLFAGVRLVPDAAPTTLAPLDDRPPVPPPAQGAGRLLRSYLNLHGPASLGEAAAFLGSGKAPLRPAWPGDLLEVTVQDRTAWIPADRVDALRDAPPAADVVRLLPPSDPYLQARDRALVVPDRERQKAVWRILANPGALLAEGEIAGVWRARKAGRTRLDLTVEPFEGLSAGTRSLVDDEAERVASLRGATDVRVIYDSG